MKERIFYSVNAPVSVVYNTILDFKQFGELHPYMKSVELIHSNPEFSEYEIRESVLVFGFIPMKPHYRAKVFEIEKGKQIRYVSLVQNRIPLTIDFFIEHSNEDTVKVTEQIEMNGNRLFTSVLMPMMKKTHRIIFQELNSSNHLTR